MLLSILAAHVPFSLQINYVTFAKDNSKLDYCIVWNEHNTTFGSKAISAQAVYFLHSTMPSVMCLRVSYLQFRIQACFSSMSAKWHGVLGSPNNEHCGKFR